MSRITMFLVGVAASVALLACSGGTDETKGADHAWKGQTEALEKAKSVEQTLADEAGRRAGQGD